MCAPPELRTTTAGLDSSAGSVDSDDAPVLALEVSDDTEPVDEDALDDEPEADSDDDPAPDAEESDDDVDEDEDSLDWPDSDVSANAIPGALTTAEPMPNATASAPTRPIALAAPDIDEPTSTGPSPPTPKPGWMTCPRAFLRLLR